LDDPEILTVALHEQRDWLCATLRSIGAGIITTDLERCVTFMNPSAESLTGWPLGEAAGQPLETVFRIHNQDTRLAVESPAVRALRDGVTVGLRSHTILAARDSTEWPIDAIASPIRDSEERVVGAVMVFRDITARMNAAVAMEISEERYRRLFETAKDGILILDANTLTITDANPFMTELLGYTYEEFLGKELWQIGLFTDKSASQAMYREMQKVGYIRYNHLPLETKYNERAEVEFISNVYRVDDRLVAQCNIRDITERSRLEQQSAQQAEALAELHRRKDEFLAMLSHELRNPLAPILNAVQLLRMQANEDPFQQRARTIIERQVGQLTRIVDDLLEISRISTGRIHLRLEQISLGGIVEQAVETVRPLIEQHRHTLNVSLPAEPLWIEGDGARIEQVIVNLLTNSAKYTEDGGSIVVTLDSEKSEAVLRVRDSGVGIAPELMPRIFELFTQADRSLDRSQGGLGIGLSLVQRLVDMHGGQVDAFSALGLGSEFVVRLPMIRTPIAEVALIQRPHTPITIQLRVLVVDDNRDAAQSMSMLLSTLGHEVRTGFDGPGVEALAREFRPDVILLDIGLPHMDGLAVAANLRSQSEFARVTLVAVTGYGQDSDRDRSAEAGFDHHLVKPANIEALQEILSAGRPA